MIKFLKILQFFRLVDDNSQLSLTNVALILSIVKLAILPVTSVVDLAPLLLSLLAHQHDKIINKEQQ